MRGGNRKIRLLGNNPLKRDALEAIGLQVESQQPLVVGVNPFNVRYLGSKREHGHLIPSEAVGSAGPAAAPGATVAGQGRNQQT